jgi:hypothetical protein
VNLLLTILLSFGAVAKAKVQPPNVAVGAINQTFTSQPLDANADNAATLNTFLASLPEGTTVSLPAGVWPVHSPVTIHKRLTIEGPTQGECRLKLIASGVNSDVIQVGKYNDPGSFKANNVTIKRLTLEVAGQTTTGLYNCLDVWGDDINCEDVTLVGSPHEGVVTGGFRASFLRCKALGCGFGNQSYFNSTAGFNGHSHPTIYRECYSNSRQAFEVDGHGSKVIDCLAECAPGTNSPVIGVNIGSTPFGISDVEVTGCRIVGYESGIGFTNGIGRLANVNVHHNVIDGGSVGVGGGRYQNLASDPSIPVGPDTGQSYVENNLFIVRTQHQGIVGSNTGPADGGNPNELGREPVRINGNIFLFLVQVNDAPTFHIAGNYAGAMEFKRNYFIGQNAAPSRGDIQTYTSGSNPALPGQPNLTMEGNQAFKGDGTVRPLVVRIEGSP